MTERNDPLRNEIRQGMYSALNQWAAADALMLAVERANGDRAITALLAECAAAEPAVTSRSLGGPCDPMTFGQQIARVAIAGDTCDGPDMGRITSAQITIPDWTADHATT